MALARLAFRVLLILLILLVLIGLLLPPSAEVERSIVIDAPPDEIFPQLNSMRAFNTWSPWGGDADTRYEFSGPEQGAGSRMTWQSDSAQAGFGAQEIVASVPARQIEMRLEFGEKGGGTATFLLEPQGGSTLLRWRFRTEFGWDLFDRYVGLMLDNLIGTSYEKGLRALKTRIEQAQVSGPPG